MLLALVLAAAPGLPNYFTLPSKTKLNPEAQLEERYGQAATHQSEGDEKRGRHWAATAQVFEAKDQDAAAAWAVIKKSLSAGGWTVAYESLPTYGNMRYQKGGKDVWAIFALFGWDDVRIDLIEVGPYTNTFVLTAPAAKPEPVLAGKDYPWLQPPAGAKWTSDSEDDGPFFVTDKTTQEQTFIAPTSTAKRYEVQGLSTLELVTMYREAFTRAGWRIQHEAQGLTQSDMTITAQYAKGGRNLWAYLHGGGADFMLKVADVGALDLAKALEKECHVALSGVNFDFNLATLKPESTPVLEKVAAVLTANKAFTIEVQGHTDNVGGDASNQKLSEARAATVMKWLAAHRIEAKRLSSKGYGKSQPVAENESAEGRAKNRRVELRRLDCK